MTRHLLVALCMFAITAGCKKKEEKATPPPAASPTEVSGSGAAPAVTPTPAAGTATPAKAEYKPDEIFKETAGQSHMDLMEKFKDGATVTGTVKSVKDDPTGEYNIVFDAGDNRTVEAMLNDPKPARDKKLKAGDTVTVTKCQVANPTDTMLPLRTCDLK